MSKPYLDSAPDPMARSAKDIFLAEQNRITRIAGFRVTPVGLVAEREMEKGEWEEIGEGLRQFHDGLHWMIGDWMAYGERRWSASYEALETATGFAVKTLYNDCSIAKKIEISRRRENLGIAIHAEVAALFEAWQEILLDYVEKRDLKRAKLRKLISALRDDGGDDDFQHENPQSAKPPWARDMFDWFDLILEELQMEADSTGVIPEATVLDAETVRRLDWLVHLTEEEIASMDARDLNEAEETIIDSQDYLNALWEALQGQRRVLQTGEIEPDEAPVRMKVEVKGLTVSGEFVTDDVEEAS